MQQTVLVTGASSGLGKSIATHLHTLGHTVFGTSRKPQNYPDFPYPMLALDIGSQASVDLFFAELRKRNTLMCWSTMLEGITGAVEEVNLGALRAHFDTNFFGPLAVTQQVLH